MGIISRFGDRTGHGPVAKWDPTNQTEVLEAERVFKELIAPAKELQRTNMLAGVPLKPDQPAHVMFDISDPAKARTEDTSLEVFDPAAEEILAVPQLIGG